MKTIIADLVSLTQGIAFDELPPGAIQATKRAVLDTLGCAIAAQGCEPAAIAGRAVSRGGAEATVIGEAGHSSIERAVLVNGILARYLDFMDVYWAKDICHPAENIPLALACVESVRGSGRALIEAVAAGYEAQLRLTHALSFTDMGMHHVSAAGIVSPLIIGKAWGLEAGVVEQAVALGGCRQLALHALSRGGLSMAKAIGYPWSAMSSVLATRLAQGGFTGPVDFIDWLGNAGPLKSAVDRDALKREGPYMIERVSFKQFPVQFELQTPVEVAIRLRAGITAPATDIAAVEIHVLPGTITRTADPAKFVPANRETADHSLPVCVAMALLDGKLTTAQFEKDRWSEPDVAALVKRTRVLASEEYARRYPDGRPAGMDVRLTDGRTLTEFQDAPSGDATRPLDDRALERKFLLNAAEKLGERRAAEIAECVQHLEELADVGALARLLAATGSSTS